MDVSISKLPIVSSALEYGHFYFLKQIAKRIGLISAVQDSFDMNLAEALLSLAYFQILEGKPFYLYGSWCEDLPGITKLTSQKISNLLHDLGSDDSQMNHFFHQWANTQKPLKGVWLDITSLSSYSQHNNWVEWGYNRDKEALPQVNLGVLVGGATKLPFFYQLYPGSIADVSTLHNIALRANDLGFEIATWIMDRGFFSTSNIESLSEHGYSFITAMPSTLKITQNLLASSQAQLRSPVKSFCLGKEALFYHETTCTIGTVKLHAYIYLSDKRRTSEMELFIRKMESLEQLIQNMQFDDIDSAKEWLNRQWRGSAKFYTITLLADHSIHLKRKRNALSFRMNRMGKMILITNRQDMTPKEILDQYRNKDRVEKVYDVLKNSLNEERLRTHTATTMHGKMFVTFLALIIQTEITNQLYASTLSKTYTLPEIIMELKKIRLFRRSQNQPSFISEISKKQRTIFEKFNLQLPSLTSLSTF